TFLVPRDIDYSFGNGKISMYGYDYNQDFTGFFNQVKVGGFNNLQVVDTTGPEIRLFMNDTLFRYGGITGTNPYLLALITDQGGINTTGTGIGHDIVSFMDDDRTESTILNNYFEYDPGSYTSGSLRFKLNGIDEGGHEIILKAWDNFNNSGSEKLLFIVKADGVFTLNRLLNFPNPFSGSTSIGLEHNRPGEDLMVTIDIFSSNGRLIKRIITWQNTAGYNLEPIVWDGVDNSGNRVASGIYIYSVTVKSGNNETASLSGRMVIL
ncbi:MAG: T9SS type A sorting domain-containing protein, partial [Bacteroidia bacterium]